MKRLQSGARKLEIELNTKQLEQFEVYYRELVEWNQRMNLTSIVDYEEVQVKHFLDSLTVIPAIGTPDKRQNLKVIDVGTGAGMPGIPLKIIRPDIRLVLLEATVKKTKFLRYVIDKMGLDNVEVVSGRAEDIAHDAKYREYFDLALSRAVATLPALVELALPFCAVGGRFIALKKGDIRREIERSRKAVDVLGGQMQEVKSIILEEPEDNRCLVIIDKVKSSPAGYPRRPGIPAKRPIISPL